MINPKTLKKVIAAMLVVCLVLLAGCVPKGKSPAAVASSSGNIVIKFGHAGADVEEQTYKASFEGADKKFGVSIEYVRYPSFSSMWDQIPMQIAARSAPDIVGITNENYLQMVEEGVFLDMSPYLTKDEFDFSKVSAAHKAWEVNGKIYGIPQDGAPAAFIVNMDLWKAAGLGELPKTWDEVRRAAIALTKGNVKGFCTNVHEFHITQFILSYGGGWNMGKTIDSPENIAGLQFFMDLHKDGYAITPVEAGLGWDGEVFARGLAAMSTGGVWYSAALQEMAPDINFQIIPIPKGTTLGCTSHSDANAVISSTAYPEIASKMAAYAARDEAQNYIAEAYGNPPAYTHLQGAFFATNKEIQALIPAMAYAQAFNYPIQTKRFVDSLLLHVDEAMYGQGSVRTARDVLQAVAKDYGL